MWAHGLGRPFLTGRDRLWLYRMPLPQVRLLADREFALAVSMGLGAQLAYAQALYAQGNWAAAYLAAYELTGVMPAQGVPAQAVAQPYTKADRLADLRKLKALPIEQQRALALAQLKKLHEALDVGPLGLLGPLNTSSGYGLAMQTRALDQYAEEAEKGTGPISRADRYQYLFVQSKILANQADQSGSWGIQLDNMKEALGKALDTLKTGAETVVSGLVGLAAVGGLLLVLSSMSSTKATKKDRYER